MKTIDRFELDDDETTVEVEVTTTGPAVVAVRERNFKTGDRVLLLLSTAEAQRVGQALLKAAGA